MPRARRLASTVVVATLAVTGLAACNQAPDVAVYFGDKKAVTEDEVQRVYNDASTKLVADETGNKVMKINRQAIVTYEASVAALSALGKQRGFSAAQEPLDQVGTLVGLEPTAAFTKLYADFLGWRTNAVQNAQATEASDADLHAIYNELLALGAVQGQYEQFVQGLTADQKQQLAQAIAVRDELTAESKTLHIKVNPRYSAPVLPLLTAQGSTSTVTLVGVTLGSGAQSAPVEDLG
jgi:hypothetical protein